MKINFFCPMWGMDQHNISAMLSKISAAGYNGVEFGFPLNSPAKSEFTKCCGQLSLQTIGQQYGAAGSTFADYKKDFIAHLKYLAGFNPSLINSHTGKDYYSTGQTLELLQEAAAIEKDTGIPIMHETHRGRFPFCVNVAAQYVKLFPQVKYVADFSHFCTVSESYLHDQLPAVKQVIKKSAHIHARVGHTQGPQVTDLRLPEWKEALQYHLKWWDSIISHQHKSGAAAIGITPEFGPHPYMAAVPGTGVPIADQWAINLYMMQLLRNRYTNKFK